MDRRTRRQKVEEMAQRGATPGERRAAREALNRMGGEEEPAVKTYTNGFSGEQGGWRLRWFEQRQAESAAEQRERDAAYRRQQEEQERIRRASERATKQRAARREKDEYQRDMEWRAAQPTRRPVQPPPPYGRHIPGGKIPDTELNPADFGRIDPISGCPAGYTAQHERPTNNAGFALVFAAILVLCIKLAGG